MIRNTIYAVSMKGLMYVNYRCVSFMITNVLGRNIW